MSIGTHKQTLDSCSIYIGVYTCPKQQWVYMMKCTRSDLHYRHKAVMREIPWILKSDFMWENLTSKT